MSAWYEVKNLEDIASPALLIYPDRVRWNLDQMLAIAGGPERLRPHVKTHKLPELVRQQIQAGITKFKAATLAEAEMAARAGAADILIAYPMVGPGIPRLLELVRHFPNTRFSCLADDAKVIQRLSRAWAMAPCALTVLLDIDCGQNRTGVPPDSRALALYRSLATLPGLVPGGLHVYDGHITEPDPVRRAALCDEAWKPVEVLIAALERAGLPVPQVIAGGTPTFPIHAQHARRECSPGTCLLWDFGYADKYADLNFQFAALLLTRVISKPGERRLCLDLGHKAVASENPHPRVRLLNLPDATAASHSEEHLVVECPRADDFDVGDAFYGVPRHICPTVALYAEATVIEHGARSQVWRVIARDRRLTL